MPRDETEDGLIPSFWERLAERAELRDVVFSRLEAAREELDTPSKEVQLDLAFSRGADDADSEQQGFEFRITARADHPSGRVIVACTTLYSVPREFAPLLDDKRTTIEFANREALLVAVPYIRQAMTDMALRVLGVPIFLPVLRQGQVEFDSQDSAETTGPGNDR